MTDSDLARQVRDVSRLTGEFVLRSGRIAHEYFDKYQFEADPVLSALGLERVVGLDESQTVTGDFDPSPAPI